MPFARPTLAQERAQTAADLAAALPGADPLLPTSNLGVIADIQAEGGNALYGYLDYIARQSIPFTAEGEAFLAWAAFKNQVQKPATQATDHGVWTGAPTTVLPGGTPVTRGDGAAYVTVGDAVVGGGGTVTAPVQAVQAGASSTLLPGSILTLGVAVPGISSSGTAVGDGTPGTDLEDFSAFKTRVLAIFANPPQGGAIADYVEWAEQAPGVTRAWVIPNGRGAGTVVVYFMMDVAEAAHGGFPQGSGGVASAETRDTPATQDPLTVANHIFPLQPVTALVYALPPLQNTVHFTISLGGASTALKAAVDAAIDGVFLADGAPGGTLDADAQPAGILALSRVEAAIAAIQGTKGFVITAVTCDHGTVSPGSDGNVTSSTGYLPVRGATTWP